MSHIARQRLHSQQIAQTAFTTPAQVVAWLGAMQGQDYAGAKWSVGLRLPSATDADVEAAIDSGAIVRSWFMRGTLHLVAAEDVHWLLKLIEPSVTPQIDRVINANGMDAQTLARAYELIAQALDGGVKLDRTQLLEHLQNHGIPAKAQFGRYVLHRASATGLIGQGPTISNRQTFMRIDHLPPSRFSRPEALAELARRYFTSRGPATVQDFAYWAALTQTDARAGLEAVKHELEHESVGKLTYWLPANLPQTFAMPRVEALPGFDEYLLGYKDRSASLDADHYRFWCPGKNGMFNPTIVSSGRVVGMWKRTLQKGTVTIQAEPIVPLSDDEAAAFTAAAQRYADFLGLPAVIQI
jgi:hypothetical protein